MQSRIHTSPDGGNSWQPASAFRATPGGPDTGQADKSQTGLAACNTSGGALTVPLWTVSADATGYITDLELSIDASVTGVTAELQVGGVTVWQCPALVSGTPTVMRRRWPIAAAAGQAVTLVLGQASGPANVIFDLAAWEE